MRDVRIRSLLLAEARRRSLTLPADCLDRLVAHDRLLTRWNRAVRLIGSTDPEEIVQRHILESLALLPLVREQRGSLLDIGSGNGFPAIPLKCALPDLRVGLMEPTVRKGAFLRAVIADLKLADTEVIRDRIDRPADLARYGRWDTVTMRGVAAIPVVMEGALEALRPGGRLIFLVGEEGRAQILSRLTPPLVLAGDDRLPDRRSAYAVVLQLAPPDSEQTVH